MASWRNKPNSEKGHYQKRRTFEEGKAEIDAAHVATCRLYCDALRLWRRCGLPPCRRHRRCTGHAIDCLGENHYLIPQSQRTRARKAVLAGGPRRIVPATHIEWTVRRSTFAELLRWQLG